MENKRKELRYLSLGMFALIILQIIDILQFMMNLKALDLAGVDAAAAQVALPLINSLAIIPSVIGIIILAILGIKGLKEAKDPTSARFHIVLAFIASVCYGLSTISDIGSLFKSTDLFNAIGPVLLSGLFFIDTLSYALTAKAIRVKE